MSAFKDGNYYALISSPTGDIKILLANKNCAIHHMFSDFRIQANNYGIEGNHMFSAEDKAYIKDENTLKYSLERNHTIILSKSKHPWKDFGELSEMARIKNDKYCALISSPTGELKILTSLSSGVGILNYLRQAVNHSGIKGDYVFSAKDKAWIQTDSALEYSLERNHTLIVSESKYPWKGEEDSTETATKEKSTDLDLQLTSAEIKALKTLVKSQGEEVSPTEEPIPNIKNECIFLYMTIKCKQPKF